MKLHPLCKLFPEITGEEFKKLVADIKTNGLGQKIVTLKGQILDGQNRFNACKVSGIKPEFEEYNGNNPAAFIISQNLNRRHLTESQRAMIAAEIAKCQNSDTTITEAAKTLNVSRDSAHKAKRILKASPRLAKKVRSGKISLHAADKKLHPGKPKQETEINRKPLPRGGLIADAIRAREASTQSIPPKAMEVIANGETLKKGLQLVVSRFTKCVLTPEEFQFQMDALEKLIPKECDHATYADIAKKFVERQMKFETTTGK